MIVDKRDATTGDRVGILLDYAYSGTAIERTDFGIRLDYINIYGQHKRDQWIGFSNIKSCYRSDVPERIITIITKTLKNDL